MRRPFNGTKTHPLSQHALDQLRTIVDRPRPTQQINAGVIERLLREELIEVVQLPSPYATHRGKRISFAKATESGIARVKTT